MCNSSFFAVCEIIRLLNSAGYEAYFAGGCVRDRILNKKCNDYDIATSAPPERVLAALPNARVIPTGIAHGTVTVIYKGVRAEVTTYRVDGDYADFRRPQVVHYTKSLIQDLSRRDFTMNAMAMDCDGQIIDPFGGQDDIRRHVIRCVGNPEKRFSEDALRILRAVRFSATLGFDVEKSAAEAIHKTNELLLHISAERIFSETEKLLSGNYCQKAVALFGDVIKTALGCESIEKGNIDSLEKSTSLRLAALIVNCGDCRAVVNKLKTSTSFRRDVLFLTENVYRHPADEKALLRLLEKASDKNIRELIALKKHICPKTSASFEKLYKKALLINCRSARELKLRADVLAHELNLHGEKIGVALETLFDAVCDNKVKNEEAALLRYAQVHIRP